MTHWRVREELSQRKRLRRSYYELLRDDLDQQIIRYALLDSYRNFREKKIDYPYVEKRELKPRARIPDVEHEEQNAFLVILAEDTIPGSYKKYLRFFDANKTTKKNLTHSKTFLLSNGYDRTQKYMESVAFNAFLENLLPVDYALLIQRDPASKARDRYWLSHFHVKIDWPIADATEVLAQKLRYISKDLYEKGEKYAEDLQKKFFEYYGLSVMAGGRRTATIVAAEYLRQLPFLTTVYAGSSESRALLRISERGVSKHILIRLDTREVQETAAAHHLTVRTFKKKYAVFAEKKRSICIFRATYGSTEPAKPPYDGKLRELKPDLNWQTVIGQHILPAPGVFDYPPLGINLIYN